MTITKKIVCTIMAAAMLAASLTGCNAGGFDKSSAITVISREKGSGTRGAFIELFGIEQKDADGNKVDYTIETGDITQSTGVMLTSVAQDANAIGYVSLGSLNDTVKALQIDGAEATVENIKSGTYKISRPFNIVVKNEISEVAQDFIDYILSTDGQKIVEDNGYISISDAAAYSGTKPAGKISVAGSSSVSPVMEKLIEAYKAINPNAAIEINTSDSTTGVNSAVEGVCDIGMASRGLKDSEIEAGANAIQIALDGIAVIVNNDNTIDGTTAENVMKIYTGAATVWSDVA